ncbi:protein of unknown function [Candidatus Methylocalor cossyra]|uniref:Uncharacterized protein n=1 Tax=Candidatus Methylocalor cossyra TaxID=3108543 RepID=A0ABM9NH08_9GAMM
MLTASQYDTDKNVLQHYLQNYEEYFEPLRQQEIRLLELGVYKGDPCKCGGTIFRGG